MLFPALFTVFVAGGLLIPFRDQAVKLWAAPEKVETLEEATKTLKDLYVEQKQQNDRQEVQLETGKEITELQIRSLKEQLQLIKELKK